MQVLGLVLGLTMNFYKFKEDTLTLDVEFADKRMSFPAVPEEELFHYVDRSVLVFKHARS
jgi:hypothetical protein